MIVRIYKGMLTSLFGMWKSNARPSQPRPWLQQQTPALATVEPADFFPWTITDVVLVLVIVDIALMWVLF